jgi:hypothetical protein
MPLVKELYGPLIREQLIRRSDMIGQTRQCALSITAVEGTPQILGAKTHEL